MSRNGDETSPARRLWRRAPDGLRNDVNRVVTALAQRVGQLRGQLERGGQSSSSVCVMGFHRAVLGLGRGARLFQSALNETGIPATAWDISRDLGDDLTLPAPQSDFHGVSTVVAHLNPIEHLHCIATTHGPRPNRGLRVGYWAWETSKVPDEWIKGIAAVDEVWCPSNFTADAVRALLGDRRPVHVVPHPIPRNLVGLADKKRFGMSENKVTFFSACDLHSSLARKNPFGAIEAFRRSGCGATGKAALILKVHGDFDGSGLPEIQRAAHETPGVRIIDAKLSSEEMKALRSSIDVVLSPHRSEGFGLVLAEAMSAAKPVIATGWSGNMDFMDEASAALISAKEVPVVDTRSVYSGGTWAEPDLDHAAHLIKELTNDPDHRQKLGQAGYARITEFADMPRWHAMIKERLRL